ncbi:hypothetical protein C8F04DRAFT_1195830 [Mycena alexandri]|uniref:Uncharacterized protein n=1 Tax=Mycena alexandri TaxID=1745969 RepID=A0AAD6S4P0_9AGAR|nr:hypothetical protein C8F04DRAFT_1195830 [Mycena alexandri]
MEVTMPFSSSRKRSGNLTNSCTDENQINGVPFRRSVCENQDDEQYVPDDEQSAEEEQKLIIAPKPPPVVVRETLNSCTHESQINGYAHAISAMSVLIGLQRPVCEDEDEEQSAEEEQKLIIDPCREHDGQHRSYFLNVDGTAVVEGSAIFKFLVSQRILRPRPLAAPNSAPALKAALSWLSVKNGQLENTKTTDLPRPLRFGCAVAVSTPHSWTVFSKTANIHRHTV